MSTADRSSLDVTTTMPSGAEETAARAQKLAAREEDLRSAGGYRYVLLTTVAIPAGDHVVIVDTFSREEVRQ